MERYTRRRGGGWGRREGNRDGGRLREGGRKGWDESKGWDGGGEAKVLERKGENI